MRTSRCVFVSVLSLVVALAATAQAQTKTAFSSPTTGTSWVVPAGVTIVTIKAWGGGGGADQGDGQWGGGAGYAQAEISVTAGETLTIRVAGGGVNDQTGNRGGGGGGYSGLFRGTTPLLIAGGGGGGGSYGWGAPGGGATAANAAASGYGAGGGQGGSQSAGGVHGANDAGYAQNGAYLQGGQGGWVEPNQGTGVAGGLNGGGAAGKYPVGGRRSGGGGGGGYFGGGGGASQDDGTYADSTGGGGGSNYVTGGQTVNLAGSGYTAANTADADYVAGVGKGGVCCVAGGGAGRVVVIYTAVPVIPQIAEYNDQGQLAGTSTIYHVNSNLGVGTQTPAYKLDVAGQLNASTGLCIAGDCKASWPQATNNPWALSGTTLTYSGGAVNVSGGLCIAGDCKTSWPQATNSPWSLSGTTVSYLGGTVGVGTATPAFKFDVQGGQLNASGGLCIGGDCKTSWAQLAGPWGLTGTNVGYTGGNVGIGTTTPTSRLDIVHGTNNAVRFNDDGVIRLNRPSTANFGSLQLQTAGNAEWLTGYRSGSDYHVYSYGTQADAMTVLYANGNVGIGTVAPTAKLHVAGNVIVDGNIGARYQDVAEWVDAVETLDAGTVVSTDKGGANRVRSSRGGYETAVAGVVSKQPGVLLGEAGAGRVAVAQSGRVKVKVDASFGAVEPGDLLVTSPRAGYAMKSQPVMLGDTPIHRPGTILGKALESLATGDGEILVLLTLQ